MRDTNMLLTQEEYTKILTTRGLHEVCCVYDADTIAVLRAQVKKVLEILVEPWEAYEQE